LASAIFEPKTADALTETAAAIIKSLRSTPPSFDLSDILATFFMTRWKKLLHKTTGVRY
jgi:hypothetical protein